MADPPIGQELALRPLRTRAQPQGSAGLRKTAGTRARQLGGLVYGNGRTEALELMRREGKEPPRGILKLEDDEWAVPVIFGVDAESKAAAVAFAIDHNNLTLLGGNLGFSELLAMWDEEGLQRVLGEVPDAGELLASLDADDVAALLDGPDFEPASADDQSRLDRKKSVTCPACGHERADKQISLVAHQSTGTGSASYSSGAACGPVG